MQLSKEDISKIRTASKLGTSADIKQAVLEAITPKEKRKWQEEIEEWIHTTDDYYHISQCFKELRAITGEEQKAVRVAHVRLKDKGLIERHHSRLGCYRKRKTELEETPWKEAKPYPLEVSWPLDLNALFNIYKKNTVLFAGTDDAGKTALAMDIIKRNQIHPDWENNLFLFNAEMSPEEANLRFTMHDDIELDDWNFKMYDQDSDFGSVIQPNGFNIIDYLELPGDLHYKLGDYIREIHNALEDGICVIMLHKKHGAPFGYGQELGLKIPRLYVTLENGVAKIIKCKNRKTEHSCRGMIIEYKLVQGWKIIPMGVWHKPEDDPHFKI